MSTEIDSGKTEDNFKFIADPQMVVSVLKHHLLPIIADLMFKFAGRADNCDSTRKIVVQYGLAVEHIMCDTGATLGEIHIAINYITQLFGGSSTNRI